jgi:hypothetical protein
MKLTHALIFTGVILAIVGCGPDQTPPPRYPPMVTEFRTVATATSSPSPEVASPANAAGAEDVDPALQDAPARPMGREEIHLVVTALPLRLDAVRFDAIDNFLLLYAPFTRNKALLRETRKALRAAQECLQVPMSAFPLSDRVGEVAAALKQPSIRYYFPFLRAMYLGISRTKDVIVDFHEQVHDQLSQEERDEVFGQIGNRPDDACVAKRNIERLEEWNVPVRSTTGSGESSEYRINLSGEP